MTAIAPNRFTFSFTGPDGKLVRCPAHRVGDRPSVLVVGSYLAAEVAILGADSFTDAWDEALEWLCEHHPRFLAEAEPGDDEDTDGVEWVDGYGYRVTLDLVTYRSVGLS